jgi:hypothetical protein
MVTREEIAAQIGIDHSKVKSGLRSASSDIKAWGKDVQSQVAADSGAAAFLFENSFKKTFKSLKKLFAINLISAAGDFLSYWDTVTQKIADAFTVKQSEALKENTELWHKAMDEREARAKEAAKAEVERLRELKEFRATRDEDTAAGFADRISRAGGDKTAEGEKIRMDQLRYEKAMLEYTLAVAKNRGDELEVMKAETAIHLKNIQLQDILNRKVESANQRMAKAFSSGKYDSQLQQIAFLEADANRRDAIASNGFWVGNRNDPRGQQFVSIKDGYAARERRQAQLLRAGIGASLIQDATPQLTPAQKVAEEILGGIRKNMTKGKIPVILEVNE